MTLSRNATTGPAIDTTSGGPSILTSQIPGLIVSYGTPIRSRYDSTSSALFMSAEG